MDYFPEYSFAGMDRRFNVILIRNCLSLRMGIDPEWNNLI
jgi:hypothetical protein